MGKLLQPSITTSIANRQKDSLFDNVKGMLLWTLKQGLHMPDEHCHTRFACHLWGTPRDDMYGIEQKKVYVK